MFERNGEVKDENSIGFSYSFASECSNAVVADDQTGAKSEAFEVAEAFDPRADVPVERVSSDRKSVV